MDKSFVFNLHKFDEPLDIEYLKDNGQVEKVIDNIVFASGIEDAMLHEIVLVDEQHYGIILNLAEEYLGIGLFNDTTKIEEGMKVTRLKEVFKIPVGDKILERVIDPIGMPIDGKATIKTTEKKSVFNIVPPIMQISSVNRPLITGISVIDTLTPIGRGQRQLILGNRQTGKTQIAIDTIINQKTQKIKCVYVAIGQKLSYIADFIKTLEENNAFEYTTIVSATANSSLTMQYLAPYAGMAIAEYWRDKGEDVLVIFDDLTKHASAYRAINLLFERPPGREAYPGDIFYIHSSLLERAVQLNIKNGGGSITALPIVETLSDDITAYVATNIISITDGQLFLKTELFNSGQKPAIDIGLSVSRVGGDAQYPIIKTLSKNLILILSQYQELKEFLAFDNSLDKESLEIISKGIVLLELFRQPILKPNSVLQLALILFAFQNDYFNDLELTKVKILKDLIIEKSETINYNQTKIDKIFSVAELTPEIKIDFHRFLSDLKAKVVFAWD